MIKSFTINRADWMRGQGDSTGKLYVPEYGEMCCLGFFCKALGIPKAEMEDLAIPSELYHLNKIPKWLLYDEDLSTQDDLGKLLDLNDSDIIEDSERELKIKEIFKKRGIKVKFVG